MAALPYCPKMGLSVIGAIFHPQMALRLPTNHKEAVFQCDDGPKKSYLAKITNFRTRIMPGDGLKPEL